MVNPQQSKCKILKLKINNKNYQKQKNQQTRVSSSNPVKIDHVSEII